MIPEITVESQLEELARLEENWDGYGSDPFPPVFLDRISAFAKGLDPIPNIVPTGRKSIQLEWRLGGRYIEVELFADGSAGWYCEESNGEWAEETFLSYDDVRPYVLLYIADTAEENFQPE